MLWMNPRIMPAMSERGKLPIFSLHAAGQGDKLQAFFDGIIFDDCRHTKNDARGFMLVMLLCQGVYRGIISCKNDDMKNFALNRATLYIKEKYVIAND